MRKPGYFRLSGGLGLAWLAAFLLWGGGLLLPAPAAAADAIWAGPPADKAVALTFDDGPSPRYTPKILALLARYQAQATFFVLGHKVEEHPRLVQAELQAGHEVGNHSFSHPRFTRAAQLLREQELERTTVDLDLLGCPRLGRLFRPPYSAFDERLQSYLAHTGRRLVLWSIDSGDWQGLSAPAIVHNVLARVRPGAIIIFHDSDEQDREDRSPTVAALAEILPSLQLAGWRLVTVSELVAPPRAEQRK